MFQRAPLKVEVPPFGHLRRLPRFSRWPHAARRLRAGHRGHVSYGRGWWRRVGARISLAADLLPPPAGIGVRGVVAQILVCCEEEPANLGDVPDSLVGLSNPQGDDLADPVDQSAIRHVTVSLVQCVPSLQRREWRTVLLLPEHSFDVVNPVEDDRPHGPGWTVKIQRRPERLPRVALLLGVEFGPCEIGLLLTDGIWAVSRCHDEMTPRDLDQILVVDLLLQ
jgi:hypothetical protein